MSTRTCHHVLANGALCQAVPLRNRDYCRFHLQQIGRRMRAARSRARHQRPVLKLPLLEDLYSVQIAFMQLSDALTYQEIDPQYARLLTTVLRLAMQNLKSKQSWERSQRFQVAEATEGVATAWDSFEQEHDLPTDLDLSMDPEVAFLPNREDTTGTPPVLAVEVCGNNALKPPFDDFEWGANTGQFLRDAAAAPPPLVTADDVEIYDVYEREGQPGVDQCLLRRERNRKRREHRARRLYYEQVARNHSIKLAAEGLADEQRKARAEQRRGAAARAESIAEPQASNALAEDGAGRKPPQSGARREPTVSVAGT
jgi:hypothetical protein